MKPLSLPRAEEPTQREWGRLQEYLEAAMQGWEAAAKAGLMVERLLRADRPEELPAMPGAVTYRLTGAPVFLALQPELAAALVCLRLGADLPGEPGTALTAVDLAVLDTAVSPCLAAMASALEIGAGVTAERLEMGPREAVSRLAAAVVGALLRSPRVRGRGIVLVTQQAMREAFAGPGPRLAENPGALMAARVEAQARMRGACVPLAELLMAEVGDVVMLGGSADKEVGLYVGDAELAKGRPGARDGRMAVRITDVTSLVDTGSDDILVADDKRPPTGMSAPLRRAEEGGTFHGE